MGDISLRGQGRALLKKGGTAKKGILIIIGNKDKKSKSMKKGGMIKKADMLTAKMSEKKKGKMMKGKK